MFYIITHSGGFVKRKDETGFTVQRLLTFSVPHDIIEYHISTYPKGESEMIRYECPICHTEYETNPHVCPCGFEGIEYPAYESAELQEEYEKKRLFKIYKFAKRVVTGELPYEPSALTVYEHDDKICVDEAVDDRGLAYVDLRGDGKRKTFAAEGLVVFRTRTPALYLNTDEAHSDFLDESHVRMLFFGPDFQGFPHGFFRPRAEIRYIWVNEKNPFCFSCQ